MNPPFSAAAHVEGWVADAALRHIGSALARLAEGGRTRVWQRRSRPSKENSSIMVDDPGAFKAPWTGMARLAKLNRPIVEWACAENNLGYKEFFELEEYPMPAANTPDF